MYLGTSTAFERFDNEDSPAIRKILVPLEPGSPPSATGIEPGRDGGNLGGVARGLGGG